MFNEYPKALYKDGNAEGDYVITHTADGEAEQRGKGFRMLNEPQKENEPQKRTRKTKAE